MGRRREEEVLRRPRRSPAEDKTQRLKTNGGSRIRSDQETPHQYRFVDDRGFV